MKYLGGKAMHAKQILDAMKRWLPPITTVLDFYEPFSGGANVSVIAAMRFRRVFASDINRFMVVMFQEYQTGWRPPEIVTENDYKKAKALSEQKNLSNAEMALCAFIGTACSFGAKWFAGYARNIKRNYAAEGARWLAKFETQIGFIDFDFQIYENTAPKKGDVLYCDPPYFGTTPYKGHSFDSDKFWAWAEKQARRGVFVFVSEYFAPTGWRPVWEKRTGASFAYERDGAKKAIEKLFVFEGSKQNE